MPCKANHESFFSTFKEPFFTPYIGRNCKNLAIRYNESPKNKLILVEIIGTAACKLNVT